MSQENNNNQARNNHGKEKFDLVQTVIGAEPVVVGFNITGTEIADFLNVYLQKAGVNGAGVAVQAINTGTVNPKLGIIVTLNKANRDIISNGGGGNSHNNEILPVFTQGIQTGGLRASEKLSSVLGPLSIEKKTKVYRSQKNKKFVYIPVCPIKTIAVMLQSNPKYSMINITAVHRSKGEIIVSVFKQLKDSTIGRGNEGGLFDDSVKRHF